MAEPGMPNCRAAAHQGSVLEDEVRLFEHAYVVQWVPWHGNHVREIAGLNAADPVVPAEQFSRMQGGRPDCLQRALAAADVIGELASVQSVRVDAAVSAERDTHAGLHALGESLSLRLG